MPLPRSLSAFRYRPFTLLWSGAFVSNIGRWMEAVAVGVLVTETTDQAGWTGLVAVAAFAPNAFLSPLGGALADRYHRRLLLLGTMGVQCALAVVLTLLALGGVPSPGAVTLIVFVAGCFGALGFPAYQAILPELVPRDDLPGAVALASAQWNLGRVIGPACAGIAIKLGGYSWAFGINAASYAAVMAVLVILPLRRQKPVVTRLWETITDGFRYVRNEPGIRATLVYMLVTVFLAAPFIGLIPAMAIKVFDAGTGGTAALVSAQGLGAVVTGVLFGSIQARLGSRRTLLVSVWLLPPALVLYALAPSIWPAVVAIFVVGAVYLGALSSFTTIGQLRAPDEMRGRVMSVLMMILGGLFPLGSLLQGAVGDRIGLRVTVAGAAVLYGGALAWLATQRQSLLAALDVTPTHTAASG
ncbi:MAG: MFS transporter [Acidimicrobiia bacterium]